MGVSYLAPASIYRQPTDKVPRYFATPLTEHYPVIHAAKYELGMRGTGISLGSTLRCSMCFSLNSCICIIVFLTLLYSRDGHVRSCVPSISTKMGDAT